MMKFLTGFALISASVQTAAAAAAEQHWQFMPVLAGILLYGFLCAGKSLYSGRVPVPERNNTMQRR